MKRTMKKQRSQRRKLRRLLENIDRIAPEWDPDRDMEHFHVPSSDFLDQAKVYGQIKTAFCRMWIEKTEQLMKAAPSDRFCRIAAFIDLKCMHSSQIVIFYDREYYDSFFERDNECQRWSIVTARSFAKERGIRTDLREICINCREYDDDGALVYETAMWCYGDVSGHGKE